MALSAGRKVIAIPQGYLVNVGGDIRPLYVTGCPVFPIISADKLMAVPQGYLVDVAGDIRPLAAMGGCTDGGLTAGQKVMAIPQGYLVNVGGDIRPLYVTACCPGSSSSSSSGNCTGIDLPPTLHADLSGFGTVCNNNPGSGCTFDGTYTLTNIGGLTWQYQGPVFATGTSGCTITGGANDRFTLVFTLCPSPPPTLSACLAEFSFALDYFNTTLDRFVNICFCGPIGFNECSFDPPMWTNNESGTWTNMSCSCTGAFNGTASIVITE